uniref:Uncharacterized protein n=1 Tax=Anguilla anguilla TaxID=7936 RepID=A0A0E9X9B8_ANGAN
MCTKGLISISRTCQLTIVPFARVAFYCPYLFPVSV